MSISLPEELLAELDQMSEQRGFASRSQAVIDLIHRGLSEHKQARGDEVMAGTITLFYNSAVSGLQKRLAALQYENIAEVITSLHVHLAQNHTLEVILVQGPAWKIQAIADEMITERGVLSGRVLLVAALIPPLHQGG